MALYRFLRRLRHLHLNHLSIKDPCDVTLSHSGAEGIVSQDFVRAEDVVGDAGEVTVVALAGDQAFYAFFQFSYVLGNYLCARSAESCTKEKYFFKNLSNHLNVSVVYTV